MKDWEGTQQFILSGNNRKEDSEINDYYATEPKAVELLLENEKFNTYVWECACGGGHMSKVLSDNGYDVKSSDIINRGYPNTEIIDFLKVNKTDIKYDFSRDIITNPPINMLKNLSKRLLLYQWIVQRLLCS